MKKKRNEKTTVKKKKKAGRLQYRTTTGHPPQSNVETG